MGKAKLVAVLEEGLNSVVIWAKKRLQIFNASKSKLLSSRLLRKPFVASINMADVNLQESNSLRVPDYRFSPDIKGNYYIVTIVRSVAR